MSRWEWRGGLSKVAALMLFLGGLALPPTVIADEHGRGDLVLNGDEICTRCHDEYEYYPVLSIGKTAHGVRADDRTPNCTSCHGESQAHLDGSETSDTRPLTDIRFGDSSTTPVSARNEACLSCHQGGQQIHWQIGAHSANDVACSSCHQLHTAHDKVRDRETQPEVCFECHKEQRMEMQKFSSHPVEIGKVVCADCHNAHGSLSENSLVRTSVVDTCYQCHAEKRGPFIWNHEPVSEDCGYCHEPHGSNIDGMLKLRMPMLCQNCHEGDAHRGLPPSDDGRLTTGRACANCHTNIHGSNSPTGNVGSRSLRN
ncbi:DmsE family decaheme c-type cytochrome [Motiliproteus sp. SC1-56]|uniref:DmsE family decaheme c-type cytochrome n=1 Tax=Motiliproteus sp. SC1-56 TaxID=2799565 RepID=UPI001A8D8FCF|nr:DmsE family decaheme c-type cytochrome [Motiliproteus sp. SC1-56]